MRKLIINYENRISNFVLKMAEKPIIVKKNHDKYLTTREELYANTSNKILDKKGFIFKSYKTDRERIDEFLNHKKNIEIYINSLPKKHKKKTPENILIQPSMRFKARTELERIYDSIKDREGKSKEEKMVQNQLLKMGFVSQNVEEYTDNSDEEEEETENEKIKTERGSQVDIKKNLNKYNDFLGNIESEEKRKKSLHNKILKERKDMIHKRKILLSLNMNKHIDSNQAKHLREELHQKLHFKAMENLSMFKTSTMNHNLFKTWSQQDIKKQKKIKNNKNIYYANITNGFYPLKKHRKKNFSLNNILNSRNNNALLNSKGSVKNFLTERENEINFVGNKKLLQNLQITKDIASSNPLLYNLNFRNIKNLNKNSHLSKEKLESLKKLAFINNDNKGLNDEEDSDKSENNLGKYEYEDLKRQENIIIGGEQFKKNETDKIADKLLTTCNWNENKVKYKGYFGKGKLMFTSGLTLREFEEKYGIIP